MIDQNSLNKMNSDFVKVVRYLIDITILSYCGSEQKHVSFVGILKSAERKNQLIFKVKISY